MQKITYLVITILLSHRDSYGQKSIYPLKDLLKDIDTLIFKGSPRNNRGFKYDTLFATDIAKLAQQKFANKKVQVEKYGATPDGSISLYRNGKRIALIGCWHIDKNEYGVNIAINEEMAYQGLTISKSEFDELFIKTPD